MQFTAAAVLRLVDDGKLTFDSSVGEFLPKTPGAEKITVRDLRCRTLRPFGYQRPAWLRQTPSTASDSGQSGGQH